MVDRVLIVATGPSVEGVKFPDLPGVHIIAVNTAIKWLPRADSFFSMDPDQYVLPLLAAQRPGVRYYVAIPDDYRIRRDPSISFLRRLHGSGPRGTRWGLATNPNEINAGNSAHGALGLAYHWRPKHIAILGLDATDHGHAYEQRDPGWSLRHLPRLFASSKPQLDAAGIVVANGSPKSLVTCFARIEPEDAIEWIAHEAT